MDTATALLSTAIPSTAHANRMFGEKDPDGTYLVLWPDRNTCLPYIAIPEGMYALVQASGADQNYRDGSAVWPAGYHKAGPLLRVSHLITKQLIVFDTPVKGCKTMDDVTVQIDVAIMFRIMGDTERGEDPELVRKFVYQLTPRGLQTQLADAQEEAIRTLARSVRHENVYALRSAGYGDESADAALGEGVTADMQRSLNEQFNQYGVEITDVAITNVRLPPQFADQMQEKTTYDSRVEEQRARQQNDMQLLSQNEDMEAAQQEASEQQQAESQLGDKMAAEEQKKLDRVLAANQKIANEKRAEMEAVVLGVESQSDLVVTTLVQEKNRVLEDINARAMAECEAMRAEMQAAVQKINAEADLQVAQNEARANEILAEVEGQSASTLRARRELALAEKQLGVIRSMAHNDQVTITGNTTDNLLGEVLVAQRQSQIMLNVNAGGSS